MVAPKPVEYPTVRMEEVTISDGLRRLKLLGVQVLGMVVAECQQAALAKVVDK